MANQNSITAAQQQAQQDLKAAQDLNMAVKVDQTVYHDDLPSVASTELWEIKDGVYFASWEDGEAGIYQGEQLQGLQPHNK